MARRAWLLVTPDMLNELYEYAKDRRRWVVDNALPEDVTFVGSKPARNGAHYYLCESRSFDDVTASDYPLLPTPKLRGFDEWLKGHAEAARQGNVERLVI